MADYHTMFQSFADFFEELPTVSEPMKVTTTVECSSESVCAAETFISTPNNELNPALVGIAVVVATAILFWPTSRAIRKPSLSLGMELLNFKTRIHPTSAKKDPEKIEGRGQLEFEPGPTAKSGR
ncbi:hypothetical protein F5878DRAFT_648046 [Lentinula raphanica]|uniref:Uncharacterized protein n=1 Tax=Lentinula raphanica TaxID=153919 RepID=A0AA38U923_9AGAR|nr:hypothetical protein F5878DRAFT_648046 [Lentinula raphanica]